MKIRPFLPRIACSRQIASCKCILQVCKNPPFSCTVEPAPNWARNIVIWEEFQWRRQIFLSLWSYSRFDNLNWKLQQRVGPSFQNVLNIRIFEYCIILVTIDLLQPVDRGKGGLSCSCRNCKETHRVIMAAVKQAARVQIMSVKVSNARALSLALKNSPPPLCAMQCPEN